MLPSRSLIGLTVALGALLATAPASQAAWPGTPGKIAYLDQASKEYPLKVYTPEGHGGRIETIVAETFHFQDGAGDKAPPTTGFPSAPVWSPDGTRLAYAAKIPDPSLAPGATHTAIFTWRLRDGEITQVSSPPGGSPGCSGCGQQLGYGFGDYSPAWSPDGKRIAFVRLQASGDDESIHDTDGGNVRMVAANGGSSTEITHSYGEQLYTALSWGGDPEGFSALIGLHGSTPAHEMTVRRIDPDSGETSTELGSTEAAMIMDFDVAPDGLHFLYQHAGGATSMRGFGGNDTITPLGKGVGARMRASPTGNGPLFIGQAKVPGQDLPQGGLVEYQGPDPGGDVWPEDPKYRWVNGFLAGTGKYALTTIGRSVFDVQAQRLPIINIPGFGGSEIRCDGERLWGPSILFMGSKLKAMELGEDGKTNAGCTTAGPTADPDDPTGFVMSVLGEDIYAGQAKFITDIAPGARGWRFSWDWRKSPAESLARLDALVDKALAHDFAKDQGLERVVMYGHSYGGLLMREYQDLHPEKLARVLTLGTPFWGATKPLNFATFGMENPLSGIADLDTLLPNAAAKAFAKNLAGLYWLVPSDHYGPWLKVGAAVQDQAGVRDYFTGTAGGNGFLVDAALAWHRKFDGFSTTKGTVEVRAVVGTGLPTIERIDVSDLVRPDGELQVSLHLGQGDVTVPIRSASQGELGTHTPLGDPVHVQAVCGIGHMKLGASDKVNSPYIQYLLQGRTPRKTEGACAMEATAIVVKNLPSRPGLKRGERSSVAAGAGTSLDDAAAAGRIQLLRYPGAPVAIVDERHPVTLDVAAADQPVELEITRYKGDKQLPTVTYRPAAGAVQVAAGPDGPTVTVDGQAVEGEGGGGGGSAPDPTPDPQPAPAAPAAPAAPTVSAASPTGAATPAKATTKPKAKPKPKTKTTKKCKTIKKKVKGRTRKIKRCTTVKTKPKARPRTG
jgi:pimeloyl-ACP methyl ester carboxylesterase